ncbi:MAG TPA: M20 family metallopeptidase [Ktedonobacterales bacterium]
MDVRDVLALAESQMTQILDDLGALVNIDSGTYTPRGVARVADELERWLKAAGAEVERVAGSEFGPHLIARWRGPGRGRALLIGHMDTVFPEGEAERRPFRVADGRAYGPGVMDMKSGLLIGLYAARALLDEAPWAELVMFCNSDEEIGSPSSRSLVETLGKPAHAALVLEPNSRVDKTTIARKGVATYRIDVEGLSAHAGVEPHRGRNAILELAHRVIAVQALNGTIPGVTLNTGVTHGGERPNVVPDAAHALVDVRAADLEGVHVVDAALRALADGPEHVEGTRTRLTGGFMHQPFVQSPASLRLFEMAQEVARELGYELSGSPTGGGSDGNTTAATGAPTLDGLGAAGGMAHNPGEFIEVASIAPRIALLSGIIQRLNVGGDQLRHHQTGID